MSNIERDDDQNENLVDDREEATIGMSEIDGFDFARAAMLMGVIEKVANVAPKCTAILGLATVALNEMHEEAKEIGRRRSDEITRLEAQAQQKRAEEERERQEEAERELEANRDAAPRAVPASQFAGLRAERPDPTPGQPATARNVPPAPRPAPDTTRRV